MASDLIKNVIIVEDEPVIAHDIEIILKKNNYNVVSVCYDATEAFDQIGKLKIDVGLFDINLGSGQTGIDIARVVNQNSLFPYIFLSSYSDQDTLTAAQEHGPYGYLVKPFQEATLLTTLSLAINNFSKKNNNINWKFEAINLTKQEKKLCEIIIKGKSYKEIAEQLFISVNTVRFHIKNLYLKFDVTSKAELISKLLN